ncbi:unnamed protein product [Oikopleura dioica]|uniref:Uncharacterized protein n=1 Tax=Oikopleura dioica TaxID=34765 RepID=E4XH12_OIKDI|nr:unnamed protein product [Oikopleura dioica]
MRIPGFRHCNKPANSEMINDSSGFDCNCSSPLVLDFHECLNWGRVKICVACNKSHESQLEQTQLEVTQIPNSLDKTWICNEKGQKLYGGFEDWRREKKLPIKNAPEKIGESIEEPSDDETDESLGERTVIPNSLDTTWNGTWSTTD